MTIHSNTDVGDVHKIDNSAVAWHRDMIQFVALRKQRDSLVVELRRLQNDVERRALRTECRLREIGTTGGAPGTADIIPLTTGERIRARQSDIRRKAQGRELRDVEAMLVHCENAMHELQMRILTYDPKTPRDAATLMAFMSGLARVGHPVPSDYADDILKTCAHVISAATGPKAAIRVL